jgi:hypothetical protein
MSDSSLQTASKGEVGEGSVPTDGEVSPGRSTPSAVEKKRETRKRTKTGCLTCRKVRL